jgi:hypothetical protein
MQKRIYALGSLGSKGKTTTVKKIAKELYNIFPSAEIFPDVASLAKGEIDLLINTGKIKIGITSQGDPGTGLYGRLETHANHNSCHILVCTTRTYGETVQAVEAIEKKYDFRAVWFTNYQSGFAGEYDYLNQKSAEHIISLMRAMCSF